MKLKELFFYFKSFEDLRDLDARDPVPDHRIKLPGASDEFWTDLSATAGERAIVEEIRTHLAVDEEEAFEFSARFLRLLTQESFESFGHASSNNIKPCTEEDLGLLERSLLTLRDGSLEEIKRIPSYQFGAIFVTAVQLTGQVLDHLHQETGESAESLFAAEVLESLPEIG